MTSRPIMPARLAAAAGLLSALLAACGGGSSGGPGWDGGLGFPGLDSGGSSTPVLAGSDKLVRDLTDAELRALCDEVVALGGGYDQVTGVCAGGITRRTSRSQASCVASASARRSLKCVATLGDVRTCARQQHEQPCNMDLWDGRASAACAALITCSASTVMPVAM